MGFVLLFWQTSSPKSRRCASSKMQKHANSGEQKHNIFSAPWCVSGRDAVLTRSGLKQLIAVSLGLVEREKRRFFNQKVAGATCIYEYRTKS